MLIALATLVGWDVQHHYADHRHDFNAQRLHSLVGAKPGPVLIIGKLKWQAVQALREQLLMRYEIVECEAPTCAQDVFECASAAVAAHAEGDPKVPRRMAATLLVLRKLKRGGYWGGESVNKNYLWPDEIAKGRGVPEEYAPDARDAANTLINLGWMRRVKKQGSWKWCLNLDRREDIHTLLDTRATTDQTLSAYMHNDRRMVSARELDILDKDDGLDDERRGGT